MLAKRLLIGAVLASTALSGCTAAGPDQPASPSSEPSTTEESTASSSAPSITREVPPEQRRMLGTLSAQDLCGLVRPDELAALAFTVEPGQPREVGIEPPVRGCGFADRRNGREVLIGAQAPGLADLGTEEVELGPVRGTQVLRASDCTVYAPVADATLQISVVSGEADSDTCTTAADVAQYVLAAVVR
ncbi:DUF3558 domain-containing protein [Saccharopolyspora rhizosphaerae]|uniref:DUF3558 domain-containing protein n=1 Tax=Saccharopolyspora rhizosphaerae TaxID=2492662 RepID=A0A426JIV4_9PSEU|nr:DUF3558 family protein [Saccharopolyspora rhizosphaerae]RRO13053.1 DUF3558 domain-containing protein [Saccharopolyspora rhizosphaerae]